MSKKRKRKKANCSNGAERMSRRMIGVQYVNEKKKKGSGCKEDRCLGAWPAPSNWTLQGEVQRGDDNDNVSRRLQRSLGRSVSFSSLAY